MDDKRRLLRYLMDRIGGKVEDETWKYSPSIYVKLVPMGFAVYISPYPSFLETDIEDVIRRLVRYGLLYDKEGKITR